MNDFGQGIFTRVGIVHTRLIGEDHQHICLDQVGHQSRQRVVITKPNLVGDHRVILIHNGDNTQIG